MAHPRNDIFDDVVPLPDNIDLSKPVSLDDLDWSLPLATLLRVGTAEAHQTAENTNGASMIAHGKLDKDEYVRFLMMLWHVYEAIETALEQNTTNPVLEPTYNPRILSRSAALGVDISYHLSTPDFKTHPTYKSFLASFPSNLDLYVSRIRSVGTSETPELLLAHTYVRYLGDLSGGQFIRRRLMKVYGMPDSGEGSSSFDFEPLEGGTGKRADMGEMKKIKQWFRDGMNEGVGDDQDLKRDIVEEANLAFEFNTALFGELKEPRPKSQEDDGDKYYPIMTETQVLAAEQSKRETQNRFAFNAAVMVIVSITLSHLLLSALGLAGKKQESKLLDFVVWLWQYYIRGGRNQAGTASANASMDL